MSGSEGNPTIIGGSIYCGGNSATLKIDENKVGGGTHTYKINLVDLPNMLIPIPPLAEQHRIVEKLEQLLHEIDKLKNNL